MNIFTDLLATKKSQTQKKQQSQPQQQQKKRGIEIKSEREIEIMRGSSKIVATVLKEISQIIKPGMTTGD
ncbi:MAG TPA: hypothetical protein V6C58_18395 [Allocoleopsis sp.]